MWCLPQGIGSPQGRLGPNARTGVGVDEWTQVEAYEEESELDISNQPTLM